VRPDATGPGQIFAADVVLRSPFVTLNQRLDRVKLPKSLVIFDKLDCRAEIIVALPRAFEQSRQYGVFHLGGYLAPVSSLVRTVRIILVAAVLGATAGAGVVVALITPKGGIGEASVARARSCDLSTPVRTLEVAEVNTPAAIQNQSATPATATGQAEVVTA
jgi:hypothetical protein